ncbi:hypothetical protein Bbelb_363860 [Branchiostoma belcheri]|nr:hypothetical protein Bbelb_363860 [Branchiostoma belcheri]
MTARDDGGGNGAGDGAGMVIDYDFIAHTDTVASDVRLFLKKYNITANEEILPAQRPRHANSDNVFSDIYAQVPIEEILSVRETFKEDFDMFGYSFDQDLAKILEGKLKGVQFAAPDACLGSLRSNGI